MEYSLELPINEITILMSMASLGIITVIGLSLYVSLNAFFGKSK